MHSSVDWLAISWIHICVCVSISRFAKYEHLPHMCEIVEISLLSPQTFSLNMCMIVLLWNSIRPFFFTCTTISTTITVCHSFSWWLLICWKQIFSFRSILMKSQRTPISICLLILPSDVKMVLKFIALIQRLWSLSIGILLCNVSFVGPHSVGCYLFQWSEAIYHGQVMISRRSFKCGFLTLKMMRKWQPFLEYLHVKSCAYPTSCSK